MPAGQLAIPEPFNDAILAAARGAGRQSIDPIATLLSDALDEGLSGQRPLSEAMQDYEQRRNEASMAEYRENLHLARFQPFPEETYRLRAALREDPEATKQFFLARQGMIPRESFFNPENLQRLVAKSHRRIPLS